jgi:hypothetical protein
MRILFFLLIFLSSLPAFALTKPELTLLLKEKGIEIKELEMKGMQIYMGEVTGHINQVPFSKVQILVTQNEAIPKSEIDSVDFNGAQNLGSVVAVRFNGQYITKQDVKATIVLGQ